MDYRVNKYASDNGYGIVACGLVPTGPDGLTSGDRLEWAAMQDREGCRPPILVAWWRHMKQYAEKHTFTQNLTNADRHKIALECVNPDDPKRGVVPIGKGNTGGKMAYTLWNNARIAGKVEEIRQSLDCELFEKEVD